MNEEVRTAIGTTLALGALRVVVHGFVALSLYRDSNKGYRAFWIGGVLDACIQAAMGLIPVGTLTMTGLVTAWMAWELYQFDSIAWFERKIAASRKTVDRVEE